MIDETRQKNGHGPTRGRLWFSVSSCYRHRRRSLWRKPQPCADSHHSSWDGAAWRDRVAQGHQAGQSTGAAARESCESFAFAMQVLRGSRLARLRAQSSAARLRALRARWPRRDGLAERLGRAAGYGLTWIRRHHERSGHGSDKAWAGNICEDARDCRRRARSFSPAHPMYADEGWTWAIRKSARSFIPSEWTWSGLTAPGESARKICAVCWAPGGEERLRQFD